MILSKKQLFCVLMICFWVCTIGSVVWASCVPSCGGCQCCVNGHCRTGCCNTNKTCCGGHCITPCDPDYCLSCDGEGHCESICGENSCCDGSGNCVTMGSWSDWSSEWVIKAPPNLKQKIQDTINMLPNVEVEIEEAAGSYSSKAKDCCTGQSIIENGEKYKEISITLSADIKDICIWGPPNIDLHYDWGFLDVDLTIQVGVILDSDFSVSGTGGRRVNDCISEDCLYGNINGTVSIACRVTFEVIFCIETFWTDERCYDIVATPGSVNAAFQGSIGFNHKDACDGWYGEINLLNIVFHAEFTVRGIGKIYEYQIYP